VKCISGEVSDLVASLITELRCRVEDLERRVAALELTVARDMQVKGSTKAGHGRKG
jgi:hypothetical protein